MSCPLGLTKSQPPLSSTQSLGGRSYAPESYQPRRNITYHMMGGLHDWLHLLSQLGHHIRHPTRSLCPMSLGRVLSRILPLCPVKLLLSSISSYSSGNQHLACLGHGTRERHLVDWPKWNQLWLNNTLEYQYDMQELCQKNTVWQRNLRIGLQGLYTDGLVDVWCQINKLPPYNNQVHELCPVIRQLRRVLLRVDGGA